MDEMTLILTAQIKSFTSKDDKAQSKYLHVPRNIFTDAYQIDNASTVNGHIENVGLWDSYIRETVTTIRYDDDDSQILEKLKSKKISFMYVRGRIGSFDLLVFLEESWNIIRDYGILPDYNFLRVNINEVKNLSSKEIISIFPHRDVKIVVD